jgi:hypothetical protein
VEPVPHAAALDGGSVVLGLGDRSHLPRHEADPDDRRRALCPAVR